MSKKYKFKIESDVHEWASQFITGKEVREIPPGIPAGMDLFLKKSGSSGILIKNEDKIDLDEPGIEKFYSNAENSNAGCI